MPAGHGQGRTRWCDGACFITQQFVLAAPPLEPDLVLQRLDANLMTSTRAAGLGLLRWEGSDLMLGPLRILSLGRLQQRTRNGFAAAADRAVLGGLAAHPGGELGYAMRPQGGDMLLIVCLSDFRPRLPRPIFDLTQASVHRAAVRRAVRKLAAGS
jgi:hypothetical protein